MADVLDDAQVARILAIVAHPFAFPELRDREGLPAWIPPDDRRQL
jgi:hypothetical protein